MLNKLPSIKSSNGTYDVNEIPEICPHCNRSISPECIHTHYRQLDSVPGLYVVYSCTNSTCAGLILATYIRNKEGNYILISIEPHSKFIKKEFPNEISTISPQFVKIYNESLHAETLSLLEICGPGYRKALEFLIKDYLISIKPKFEEEIKTKLLSLCINTYIDNENIKFCASRAAWLGNDETHYIKKWEDKDLSDLKQLIELVINWIMTETITNRFKTEMATGK